MFFLRSRLPRLRGIGQHRVLQAVGAEEGCTKYLLQGVGVGSVAVPVQTALFGALEIISTGNAGS